MTGENHLKNCPFCGGDASIVLRDDQMCYARCNKCYARTDVYNNAEKAGAAWNNRASSKLMLVEDGSIDVANLQNYDIKYIIYRQGSNKPEILEVT